MLTGKGRYIEAITKWKEILKLNTDYKTAIEK